MNASINPTIPQRWVAGILVLFLYSGCEYSRHSQRVTVNVTEQFALAVLPFNNQTNQMGAGNIVTELFTTELITQRSVILAPQEKAELLLSDQTATADEIFSRYSLKELRETLSAAAVVKGTVTEFVYKKGIRERPVVGLDIKIISLQDGTILWAGSYTREELSFLFYEGSLNSTAQRMCRKIAGTISRSFTFKEVKNE